MLSVRAAAGWASDPVPVASPGAGPRRSPLRDANGVLAPAIAPAAGPPEAGRALEPAASPDPLAARLERVAELGERLDILVLRVRDLRCRLLRCQGALHGGLARIGALEASAAARSPEG